MQIVLVGIFGILIANYILAGAIASKHKQHQLKETGAVVLQDPVTGRYTLDKPPSRSMPLSALKRTDKSKMDKEAVQKTLIRICNTIYEKGEVLDCANSDKVATTWSFMTEVGITGSLSSVYNATRSGSFSCGNEGSFGRYLLHDTLPPDIVSQYDYDLNGISDTDSDGGYRTYPCGYSEIVIKNTL